MLHGARQPCKLYMIGKKINSQPHQKKLQSPSQLKSSSFPWIALQEITPQSPNSQPCPRLSPQPFPHKVFLPVLVLRRVITPSSQHATEMFVQRKKNPPSQYINVLQ